MKTNIRHKGKTGIYLIYNIINGKVYIGKAKCIYNRIGQHITSLNNKYIKSENQHFINAWHKYGRNNFNYLVLDYCTIEECTKKELFYIDLFKSLDSKIGYNKRYDSSTGMIVSKETRALLSSGQIKRYKNSTQRENTGFKAKEFWKNNPNKLKKMSIKIGDKFRKNKIAKLDYNTLKILEVFNTRQELKDKYPGYYIQAILGCCGETKNSYKGYKWKYIKIKKQLKLL